MVKFMKILLSDKCFALAIFSTMICYGMFWTIPGSLIYEVKTNINEGMHVFGYLMMVLRIGKTVGHLIAVKVCGSVNPNNYPDIHLVFMAIQCLGVFAMPFCTRWFLLAICWTFIGITLGVIETNTIFFNCAMHHQSAPKYTNLYYFLFSLGAALTPPLVDGTKRIIDNPKVELTAVCGIVGGLNFVLNLFAAMILKLRRDNGIAMREAAEFNDDKATSFKAPIISNICLTMTACLFMGGRAVMELFLLPYALNTEANLSERASYSLVQTIFISTMIMRLIGVFISPWLTKRVNAFLMIFWNVVLVLGVISMGAFRDHSYGGMILTLIILGMVFGCYQNTLLNWMTDRLALNSWNTAPFFFGTCLGSSLTPAVVPHIIKNPDGSINVDNFQTMLEVVFPLAAASCGLLMLAELLASKSAEVSKVESINLKPVIARQRYNSFTSSHSAFSSVPRNDSTGLSQDSTMDLPGGSKSMLSVVTRRSMGHCTPLI